MRTPSSRRSPPKATDQAARSPGGKFCLKSDSKSSGHGSTCTEGEISSRCVRNISDPGIFPHIAENGLFEVRSLIVEGFVMANGITFADDKKEELYVADALATSIRHFKVIREELFGQCGKGVRIRKHILAVSTPIVTRNE